MKSCDTAKEIIHQTRAALQQCNVIIADKEQVCINWGRDSRTVLLRCLKLKLNDYQKKKLLRLLDAIIKRLIYKDIAKFDT